MAPYLSCLRYWKLEVIRSLKPVHMLGHHDKFHLTCSVLIRTTVVCLDVTKEQDPATVDVLPSDSLVPLSCRHCYTFLCMFRQQPKSLSSMQL
jgi:hypothetical protein